MTRQEAIRRIVAAYKLVLGMQKDSPRWKAWDKFNFPRNAKAASSVLYAFCQEDTKEVSQRAVELSVAWIIFKGNEWKDAGLSFTLETLARHAWDSGEEFSGRQNGTLESDRLLGQAGDRSLAQEGAKPGQELETGFRLGIPDKGWTVPTKPILGPQNAKRGAGEPPNGLQPRNLPIMGEDLEPMGEQLGEPDL